MRDLLQLQLHQAAPWVAPLVLQWRAAPLRQMSSSLQRQQQLRRRQQSRSTQMQPASSARQVQHMLLPTHPHPDSVSIHPFKTITAAAAAVLPAVIVVQLVCAGGLPHCRSIAGAMHGCQPYLTPYTMPADFRRRFQRSSTSWWQHCSSHMHQVCRMPPRSNLTKPALLWSDVSQLVIT